MPFIAFMVNSHVTFMLYKQSWFSVTFTYNTIFLVVCTYWANFCLLCSILSVLFTSSVVWNFLAFAVSIFWESLLNSLLWVNLLFSWYLLYCINYCDAFCLGLVCSSLLLSTHTDTNNHSLWHLTNTPMAAQPNYPTYPSQPGGQPSYGWAVPTADQGAFIIFTFKWKC